MTFTGYQRPNGDIGIRNKLLLIAVDECCEGIVRTIAKSFDEAVVLTNWLTCMLGGNEETFQQMIAVGRNPNVAGVLVVAMGCGSILPSQIAEPLAAAGQAVDTLTCQQVGGTRAAVELGIEKVRALKEKADQHPRVECPISRLVVGVKCGGSDTSSGIASNPSVGAAVDKLVDLGATCIGGELFELQGCETMLASRAATPEVAAKIEKLIANERSRWSVEGTNIETMSIGNSVGGLTTIEEKSMGALHKMGSRRIEDILEINPYGVDRPDHPGFYLSEASMLCGAAGVNYAAMGAHIIVWTSGAAGFNNAVVPVIRVSGNKDLINPDMDIDATGVMEGTCGVGDVADAIVEKICAVANGEPTAVEGVGDSTMTLYQKDQRVETLLGLTCARQR
ncbi:MAG: UxaA family hydrolase [Butyricicoccus sp.]